MIRRCSFLAAAVVACSRSTVPLYDDLGALHRPIATRSRLAQAYFDQGLRLTYAFNHAEAIRAFREAARLDPDCGMCWWGVALAHGPNINIPMDSAGEAAAWEAIQEAGREPDDADVAVLFADALMSLRPWNYWQPDGRPYPGTTDAVAALERALARDSMHPGACHLYIHAVEKVQPERAVPCAERLAALMPGAGHLVHMPAHIYFRVGRYADAVAANVHASHADSVYLEGQRPGGAYPMFYTPHNHQFRAAAAMMIGRSAEALAAARAKEILREPAPSTELRFTTGIWYYARGLAFLAAGRRDSVPCC